MWTAKNEGSGCERIGKVTREMTERDMRISRKMWRKAGIELRKYVVRTESHEQQFVVK